MKERLEALLYSGPRTAHELTARLDVSQSTLSRLISTVPSVMMMGRARAARYGWRRELRGLGVRQPIYRISDTGGCKLLGELHFMRGGYWFEDQESQERSRWYDGLPWFIADMRPQGFIGRHFVRTADDLGLPARLDDWQDDDVLQALCRRGEDVCGNLIVGDEAVARWQRQTLFSLTSEARREEFPVRAGWVLAGIVPGSSAGGEQPKFTAVVDDVPVIVKFSGSLDQPVGRRWGDLLVAEHHALTTMADYGLPAARTDIVQADGRMFLQVERFDRQGLRGRHGLVSLGSFDDEFVGRRRSWLDTVTDRGVQRLIVSGDIERVAWQQAYAALIANTDTHFGNMSIMYDGVLPAPISPAYDMLPMLDAPLLDALPARHFDPILPLACGDEIARAASHAAADFWGRVASDERVSEPYRAIAEQRCAAVYALIDPNLPLAERWQRRHAVLPPDEPEMDACWAP